MFAKKKKPSLGFSPKPRSRKEVDQDYQNHAFTLGHKMRLADQARGQVVRLEKEIEEHLDALLKLNAEGMALPPEDPATQPAGLPRQPGLREKEGNA